MTDVVEVISDSEDDASGTVLRTPPPDPPEKLYTKLVDHRRMILAKNPSLEKEEVLSDETLQLLAVTAPQG